MKFLYQLFIYLYPFVVKNLSPFNTKAALWTNGRKSVFQKLKKQFADNKIPVIWMHCSSLGEFEQGRTLLEQLRIKNPEYKFLLTFFSPSGFEAQKNYSGADVVSYLPMDGLKNANLFFDIVKPVLIFFVKYEFWNYYLKEAKFRDIPLVLVSGIFRENQPFFKWYGSFHLAMLRNFTYLCVQNMSSVKLLASIGFHDNVFLTGDTRFDRVFELSKLNTTFIEIEKFIGNNQVIVAGSTWTEDDKELAHFANTNPQISFIIVPHDVSLERLKECTTLYKKSILYSEWLNQKPINEQAKLLDFNCIIIDNIGMLSQLYKYATIAFVGGAFGEDGVHNVLEPAVFNKPIVFGPVYEKYAEAIDLIETSGAFSIDNALELEHILNKLLIDEIAYTNAAIQSGNYVKNNTGATMNIIELLYEKRLLTS